MRFILIGPPGVGKGTMSALLEQRRGLIVLSSGAIFRAEIEAKTELGRLAQRYIQHGELVPNGVTVEMMLKRLRESAVKENGWVLDGFPRTVKQAELLDEFLFEEEGGGLDKVISLEVPEDIIVYRLSGRLGCTQCGAIYHATNKPPLREGFCDICNNVLFVREDDQPETIRQRLRVFGESTAPVIDYYASTGTLKRIDAARDAELVYADIVG
ncbi:adenylate kinase [bacterium]|nr:MAG: adenylate kinase [bacterium]